MSNAFRELDGLTKISLHFIRVSAYVFDLVHIPDDREKESSVPVDTRLPKVSAFVVFLGAERRMMKIVDEKSDLFFESLSNRHRRIL